MPLLSQSKLIPILREILTYRKGVTHWYSGTRIQKYDNSPLKLARLKSKSPVLEIPTQHTYLRSPTIDNCSILNKSIPTVREPSPGTSSKGALIPSVTTPPPPKAYQRVWRTACPALARTHSLKSCAHTPSTINNIRNPSL